MPAQTPGIGYVADSEVSLLRKIANNTAITAAGGGGGGAVDSVNGQTGVVVLDAADVGAAPGGSNGEVQYNNAGSLGGITTGTDGQILKLVGGAPEWADGAGGAVDSVNGYTGVVVLGADDVGAPGLSDDNDMTGLNKFGKIPQLPTTAMTTGTGKVAALNTLYRIEAFTANTEIASYDDTPEDGMFVAYQLIGTNGTATFTFPAAQRYGDPVGTSTVITPTAAGIHEIVFKFINGAWYYADTVVTLITSTHVPYGSSTGGLTSEAAFAYNASTNVLTVGAVSLGAGGETSVMGPQQTSDGQPLHNKISVIASGTPYTLTTSFANVDFGTNDPILTINSPGTYKLVFVIQTSLVSATTTTQSVSYKMRRTNNTAADIAGTTFGDPLPVATTTSMLGPTITLTIDYTTSNSDDAITIQGALSGALGAGTCTTSAVTAIAFRLY